MALTPEQQAQLDELTALAAAPASEDEDYEIEIYDGNRGARLPYSKGKGFLASLGIDIGTAPGPEKAEGTKPKEGKPSGVTGKYFGSQRQAGK
jgi:hypothetical protein